MAWHRYRHQHPDDALHAFFSHENEGLFSPDGIFLYRHECFPDHPHLPSSSFPDEMRNYGYYHFLPDSWILHRFRCLLNPRRILIHLSRDSLTEILRDGESYRKRKGREIIYGYFKTSTSEKGI